MEKPANFLIERIESGKNTNIMLFSHNALWPYLQQFEKYDNYHLDIFGKSLYEIFYRIAIGKYTLNDTDLIIYDTADDFDEETLNNLKKIAEEISRLFNKRVTIAYSTMIPFDEREDKNLSLKIKILSCRNEEFSEEDFLEDLHEFSILDLTGRALKKHEELENNLNRARINKVTE